MKPSFAFRWLFWLNLVLLSWGVTGCHQPCIDADNFGLPVVTVEAKPNRHYVICEETGLTGKSDCGTSQEVGGWIDMGLQLTGQRLVITVKDLDPDRSQKYNRRSTQALADQGAYWVPWLGNNAGLSSAFASMIQECKFTNQDMCPDPGNWDQRLKLDNKPCKMTKGRGLYMATVPKSDQHTKTLLQKDLNVALDPSMVGGLTYHLGRKPEYAVPADGYWTRPNQNDPPRGINKPLEEWTDGSLVASAGGQLYMKIHDLFYNDNDGYYKVIVRSGAIRTDVININRFMKGVSDRLDTVKQSIYEGLVKDSAFLTVVQVLLTIYVMFLGISIIFGKVEMKLAEISKIGTRMILVMILISPASWSFFNTYLFTFFIDGMSMAANLLATGSVSSTREYGMFDQLLMILFAKEIHLKVFSLLGVNLLKGLVMMAGFYVFWVLTIYMVFRGIVTLLLSLGGMAILISVAPIFLAMLLFERTKRYTEEWMKFMSTQAIQTVIMAGFLGFMSIYLMNELRQLVGYQICPTGYLGMYKPVIPDSIEVAEKRAILAPAPFYKDEKANTGYCDSYQCWDERYLAQPFLRPANGSDRLDQDRIERFFSGTVVGWEDIISIILLAYLFYMVSRVIPRIADGIAETPYFGIGDYGQALAQVEQMAMGAFQAIRSVGQPLLDQAAYRSGNVLGSIRRQMPDLNILDRARGLVSPYMGRALAWGEARTPEFLWRGSQQAGAALARAGQVVGQGLGMAQKAGSMVYYSVDALRTIQSVGKQDREMRTKKFGDILNDPLGVSSLLQDQGVVTSLVKGTAKYGRQKLLDRLGDDSRLKALMDPMQTYKYENYEAKKSSSWWGSVVKEGLSAGPKENLYTGLKQFGEGKFMDPARDGDMAHYHTASMHQMVNKKLKLWGEVGLPVDKALTTGVDTIKDGASSAFESVKKVFRSGAAPLEDPAMRTGMDRLEAAPSEPVPLEPATLNLAEAYDSVRAYQLSQITEGMNVSDYYTQNSGAVDNRLDELDRIMSPFKDPAAGDEWNQAAIEQAVYSKAQALQQQIDSQEQIEHQVEEFKNLLKQLKGEHTRLSNLKARGGLPSVPPAQ